MENYISKFKVYICWLFLRNTQTRNDQEVSRQYCFNSFGPVRCPNSGKWPCDAYRQLCYGYQELSLSGHLLHAVAKQGRDRRNKRGRERKRVSSIRERAQRTDRNENRIVQTTFNAVGSLAKSYDPHKGDFVHAPGTYGKSEGGSMPSAQTWT